MITYKKGNLLDTPDSIIVHGCNSQGVMGSGVAKAIRKKWPQVFNDYHKEYATNGLILGTYNVSYIKEDHKFIINAITQGGYGYDGRKFVSYDAIDMVMMKIGYNYSSTMAISMPKIGAGLGGGTWEVIEAIINDRLKTHNVTVWEL